MPTSSRSRSRAVLNRPWTHSVHLVSHKSGKASEQAASASVQVSVLKACVQRRPDLLVQQVRSHGCLGRRSLAGRLDWLAGPNALTALGGTTAMGLVFSLE